MTQRFDPVQYHEMNGSGRGKMILDMKETEDGGYVKIEDHEKVVKDMKTEVLAFLENVLTAGWQYSESGQEYQDAAKLKKKLQS